MYVVRPEDAQGNIILSLSRAQIETDWQKAAEIFDAGDIIEEAVVGANRGGLIVNVGRVRGFVPASQVYSVRLPAQADDAEREERLSQVVGDKLHLKIIELDRRRNRLILSERAATREWRQAQKERLLDDLKEGDIRRGVVSSLCDFGAFVDLGGADGLVHLSELSWSRVGHPKEVLKVDQEVDVYVLGVDRERRRIALSIKRLKPEPWSTVTERYQIGQVVTGTITNITDFGAFARLDEDIEGLIHISELSEERIDHPNAVVKEGDEVTVRIIRIDPDRQRMGLSMRRVNDDPYFEQYDWEESDQLAEPEDSAEDSES
ncbi:MAG TPA: S1 RNA-binding domain-containing protein [Chloroflexi bacterium]|nr:S1 RNA-binding domain-containing protein [Chloroflexota bacterium]